jgi:hypothetical protein
MNRSTTLYITLAALVLGAGASGLAFVKPALDEQGKLKATKSQLTSTNQGLDAQVRDLESKLNGQAMDSISYFDLRAEMDKPRAMETRTVETLASLTEIFNDNRIRVTAMEPKGETTGMNKPVPSVAPSGAPDAASPSPSPDPAAAGAAPAISLTHKAYKFTVRGEYAHLVKALSEIQGLPRAISVNQYDLRLLNKGDAPRSPAAQGAAGESATLLELSFDMSVTFLMNGGQPPMAAPGQPATPAPAKGADAALMQLAIWLCPPAAAAETVAVAPAAKAAPAAPVGRYRLEGVSVEAGELRLRTAGGTPPYTLVGITRTRAILELTDTTLGAGAGVAPAGAGGIRAVSVVASKPGVVRVVVDTDGQHRLKPQLDSRERLRLVPVAWNAKPPAAPAAAIAPKAAPAARPAAEAGLTRLQDVALDGDELVVRTTGPAPHFTVLGGTAKRLVVELPGTGIKAPGRAFPVKAAGVEQVRVVLYKNRPIVTRLVVDTDGSVRITAHQAADGTLRLRLNRTGQAAAAKPPVAKAKPPVVAASLPVPPKAAVAPNKPPAAPKATPTPMAVPAAKKPAAPVAFPEDKQSLQGDGPRLQRSLSSSYAFPIERDRVTGRSNPFKVLPNTRKPKAQAPAAPGLVAPPTPIGQAPMLPPPGGAHAPTPPSIPQPPAPAAPTRTYSLSAVILGGGQPPVAAIRVDGKTHLVGLNDSLPGNARVKSIQPDHVVLTSFNQDIRIGLKK